MRNYLTRGGESYCFETKGNETLVDFLPDPLTGDEGWSETMSTDQARRLFAGLREKGFSENTPQLAEIL